MHVTWSASKICLAKKQINVNLKFMLVFFNLETLQTNRDQEAELLLIQHNVVHGCKNE